jgi:hypothetical protein
MLWVKASMRNGLRETAPIMDVAETAPKFEGAPAGVEIPIVHRGPGGGPSVSRAPAIVVAVIVFIIVALSLWYIAQPQVRKGDTLAILSSPELSASVQDAKAATDQARANRNNVFAGVRREQVDM